MTREADQNYPDDTGGDYQTGTSGPGASGESAAGGFAGAEDDAAWAPPVGGQAAAGGQAAGGRQAAEPRPERELWSGRVHWKHYAGSILLYVLLSLVLLVSSLFWFRGWFWWLLLLVALAGVALAVRIGVRVLATRYRLTSERLFVERGIVTQTIDQTELIRVDDVRVRKLIVDRIFGLGSVDVRSTDQTDAALVIEGVADADGVAEMIRQNMRAARRKSLFIESL